MKLLVVGAGEMGRWLADTVDANLAVVDNDVGTTGDVDSDTTDDVDSDAQTTDDVDNDAHSTGDATGVDIAFTDADPAVAADAAAGRAARQVPTDTDESFEAVCLAVPMSVVAETIEQYAPLAQRAVFDLSGVMADPLSALADAAPDCERASFHPLFAPPRVPGNVAVVTDRDGPTLESIRAAMTAAGNTVFETTAAEHDAAMETVQAGAHTAVLAYALVAGDVREEFATPVSTRLTDLARTVTEGSPAVYAEIQSAFEGAESVAAAAESIADADEERFAALYERAKRNVEAAPRERHE